MHMESVAWRLIQFRENSDQRGQLAFMQTNHEIPFTIKRVYYLYNTSPGSTRGAHAHKELSQVLIALNGSFEVLVDDGRSKEKYLLTDPLQGLYVGNMVWRELSNFSADAICLVLASEFYDEADYFRNYQDFLNCCRCPS